MIHPKHMFLLEDGAKQPLPEHHTCLFTSRDPTWPTAAPTSPMLPSMYAGEAIWNAYVHNMVSPINKNSLRDQRLHPSLLENPGKHALSSHIQDGKNGHEVKAFSLGQTETSPIEQAKYPQAPGNLRSQVPLWA